MQDDKELIIDLIRHGEPVGGRRYRGHSVDDPLSDRGWQQMRDAIAGRSHWQQIFSSPMRRCCEFADELSKQSSLPLMIDERLKEVGFGVWEGCNHQDLERDYPGQREAFYNDPVNNRPDAAEPLDEFRNRVSAALNDMRASKSGHILVVTHAGVIRAALAEVLNLSDQSMYRLVVENAGISRLRYTSSGQRLEALNA